MNIYIVGNKRSKDAQEKFLSAQQLLEDIGLTPINPLQNGLTETHSDDEHFVRNIEMMLPCKGIILLNDWMECNYATIKKQLAEMRNMFVMKEEIASQEQQIVAKAKIAIKEGLGLLFSDYTTTSQEQSTFYARMIFANICKQSKMSEMQIAMVLKRDRSTIVRYMQKYGDEYRYNPRFKRQAEKVNGEFKKLNQE